VAGAGAKWVLIRIKCTASVAPPVVRETRARLLYTME